jgi:proteasome lid subunit RPN8/RPN11
VLVFTDAVLSEITARIADPEPERGGALFGLKDSGVICHLICDDDAKTSSALYLPSATLQQQVHATERQTNLVFRGIVHSHPGQLCQPSNQDLVAFGKSLADNQHIASFVAPIVTHASQRPLDQHEIKLPNGSRMSTYVARRAVRRTWLPSFNAPLVDRCAVSVMPIDEHLVLLCSALGTTSANAKLERGYFSIGHVLYISVSLHVDDVEVIILFPPIYPLSQPLVMVCPAGRQPFFVDLSFGDELNGQRDQPSWVARLARVVRTPGGYREQ